jgi:predicted metal-dependent hydrolase
MAGRTVLQGGQAKAYRPLAHHDRWSAFEKAVAAYERGDFFLAHELLEPAWMGTDDETERDLHQGLIKLAAAYVHAVRGNPGGVVKNLTGARARLANALASGSTNGGLDLAALVAAVDDRLALLARSSPEGAIDPPPLIRMPA